MARRYSYDSSYDALLRPAKTAQFFEEWDDRDKGDDDLLCAEMSRLAYAGNERVAQAIERVGFRPITFLGSEEAFERIRKRGVQGFVARNEACKLTVLAFRGTESDKLEDILADAMTGQNRSSMFGGDRIHSGFDECFAKIKPDLPKPLAPNGDRMLITGHSLGAALATLAAAAEERATLITFGSPLVGDDHFATRFLMREVRRFVDCCDVVARVPPARFDAPHLFTLFSELADLNSCPKPAHAAAELALKATAAICAEAFALADRDLKYAHVAPPQYIAQDGSRPGAVGGEEIASNQAAARTEYGHRLPGFRLIEFIRDLPKLVRANPGDGVKTLVDELVRLAGGDQVPLRDLADHAPINYVSALAGRDA